MTTYRLDPVGEKALEKVLDQGFHLPEVPADQPSLPSDLSELDDQSLMEELALFTSWADYAGSQVGLAVISERSAELDMEWQISRYYSDSSRSTPVTITKAEALQDPDVYASRRKFEEAHAYRRLVADLHARYERDATVLSRELTRRTSEVSSRAARRARGTV